jgi:hypothetical protein
MGISAKDVLAQDPELLRRELYQREMQQLNPDNTAAGAIGGLLGRGLGNVTRGRGFFASNDDALQRVTRLQGYQQEAMQSGAGDPVKTLEALGARLTSDPELAPLAMQVQEQLLQFKDKAAQQRRASLQEQKAEADIKKAELSAAQEEQMRKELADLGPNATEDQVLSVVTKYGAPDKIMAALSAKQSRQSALDQRREIAEQRLDIQRQGLDLRKDILATKAEAATEKQAAAAKGAINNAGRVIETVTEAKSLVSPFTTGVGGVLSVVPGTPAKKLANKLSTIKANLGFDRLQEMRDASPTGGALGQVAVQEINFLQSTVQTLDQLESADDITNALNKIEEYYSNWKTTLEGRLPAKYQAGGGAGAVPTASAAPVAQPQSPAALPPGVSVKKVR